MNGLFKIFAALVIGHWSLASAPAQRDLRSSFSTAGLLKSSTSIPAVDVLLDFEGASIGLFTTNRLFDGAHTNGLVGYWVINPDPQTLNIVTNDINLPLIAPVSVNGVIYTDSGSTKSASFKETGSAFHDGRFQFSTGNLQGQMGCSFFFKIGPNANLGDFADLVQLDGGGEYAVAAITFDNPPTIKLHSNTNFGTSSTTIAIASNNWYFVNLSWDTNTAPTGQSRLELRNGTNGAYIDSRNIGHGSKQMVQYVRFGKENHVFTDTIKVSFDNFMLRLNQTVNRGTNYLWQ